MQRLLACRIDKLRSVAGSTADMQHVLAKAMAGDFDPSEYDAAMASAFGEDYYNVRPLNDQISSDHVC